MNRRAVLGLVLGAVVALMGRMVPALAADAKSANGDIEVLSVWARPDGPEERTVYLEIINHSETDDRLVSVSGPQAEKCILEKVRWKGLTATKVPVEDVPIPAMSRTKLKPGGTYVRAMGVTVPYDVKFSFPLTLTFANNGAVDVTADLSTRMLGSGR